ncbi:hypothetical protein MRB53_017942 [Persea americana]|uniref:Uncharacterized protein n=1 Tax=Persea americana TaxID=3435 RepID=A0ACC2M722_PERAE|nr:hypothetical protein MRB53_017942 [Persea americana]
MKVIDLFEHAQNNLAEGTDMWEKMEAQRLSEISNPDQHFMGHCAYERSIIEFKLGNEIWEGYFEAAIERFELAGASEIDTGVTIKNHCSNESAQEDEILLIHLNRLCFLLSRKINRKATNGQGWAFVIGH